MYIQLVHTVAMVYVHPMAKTRMNFRLSDLACQRLAEMATAWSCNATAVIERLLTQEGAEQECLGETRPAQVEHQLQIIGQQVKAIASPGKLTRTPPKPEWKA